MGLHLVHFFLDVYWCTKKTLDYLLVQLKKIASEQYEPTWFIY